MSATGSRWNDLRLAVVPYVRKEGAPHLAQLLGAELTGPEVVEVFTTFDPPSLAVHAGAAVSGSVPRRDAAQSSTGRAANEDDLLDGGAPLFTRESHGGRSQSPKGREGPPAAVGATLSHSTAPPTQPSRTRAPVTRIASGTPCRPRRRDANATSRDLEW